MNDLQHRSQAWFELWELCGMRLRPPGHQDASISFPVKRYMVGKLRSLGRHRREDTSVRQTSILFQRCCFLTTKPFLAHTLLLFCTDLACWCWGIDSSCLSCLEGRRWLCWQGPLYSQLSPYIVCTQAVSRYIRTVHTTAKWAFLNNIVYASTLCVWSCVCVHLFCPSWGEGQLRSLFGVRLSVSDIHHGRYPAGPHMNTYIEANAFTSITSCRKCLL